MAYEKSIIFQKSDSSQGVDASEEWGFVLTKASYPKYETQDPYSQEWNGEDGEDAYVPPAGLPLKAFDFDIELAWKGPAPQAPAKLLALANWLRGASLMAYVPVRNLGFAECYCKEIGEPVGYWEKGNVVITVPVSLRVTNPTAKVSHSLSNNHHILTAT